ncbi:four helix bundle protein [Bacteroides fragilis]|nr:four helix bundle protein [Bacteroides fragilis]
MRNILKDKSMAFAIQIVNLHKYPNKRKAYSLSDQILISGTAIGVLQKETECAESNADFIHNIASPQKNVTKPFSGLNCYLKQNIYPKQNISSMFADANELMKLMITSIKTVKYGKA